ncbi:hypothetical protein FACS189474_0960 [Bacteroidia bacterium]|nr:hypothetical protein FACS189474_0960 [Bacteroidia bacterium]
MKRIVWGALILLVLGCFACKKDNKKTEAERIVKEWMGKEIQFPDDYQCSILGNDTTSNFCKNLFQKEYKILLYVDSTGCSDCRLKLLQWKQLIEESDSIFQGKVSFLFFFQPKNKKEIAFLFKRDHFDYPAFIDMNNTIDQINRFPQAANYQCFLLNQENKVVAIGNPVLNPKIWDLYKQTITGKSPDSKPSLTTVSIAQPEMELSGMQKGKKSATVFKLKNTGNTPLLITHVNTSCGCTVPVWDKSPIEPNQETEIRVEITPEESGFFHKTIQVYCNVENEIIPLTIKGMVEQ